MHVLQHSFSHPIPQSSTSSSQFSLVPVPSVHIISFMCLCPVAWHQKPICLLLLLPLFLLLYCHPKPYEGSYRAFCIPKPAPPFAHPVPYTVTPPPPPLWGISASFYPFIQTHKHTFCQPGASQLALFPEMTGTSLNVCMSSCRGACVCFCVCTWQRTHASHARNEQSHSSCFI